MKFIISVMIFFACFYLLVDGPEQECGIAPLGSSPTFYHAFVFSMETMTTVTATTTTVTSTTVTLPDTGAGTQRLQPHRWRR